MPNNIEAPVLSCPGASLCAMIDHSMSRLGLKAVLKQPTNKAANKLREREKGRQALFRIVRPPLPTTVRPDFAPVRPTWGQVTEKDPLGPSDFQATGSTWLIEHERGFLADDMGLGKSKQFIDAMQYVANDLAFPRLDHVLIVCEASNVDTWMAELALHAPDATHYAYRGGKNTTERSRRMHVGMQYTAPNHFPIYVVVSYNLFRSDIEEFEMVVWDCVALDEGQYARSSPLNPKSQSIIAQAIHRLKPARRYIITGTPIINSPLDLYNQLLWLGLMSLKWKEFEQYCTIIDIKVSEWQSVRKITTFMPYLEATLKKLMDEHSVRRTKAQVLNIPAAVSSRVENVLEPAQAKAYRDLEKRHLRAVHDLASGQEPAISPRVSQMQLRQFTSMANATSESLSDLVERAIENDQKVIIYTAWIETLRALYTKMKQHGVVWIYGGVSTNAKQGEISERQKVVDRFQQDPEARVLIATSQSCRVGLTLTAATVVIFVDDPWSPKNKQQNIDRAVRIGQTKVVNVYSMYAVMKSLKRIGKYVQTIDGMVERVLNKKGKEADAIMEGRVTPTDIAKIMEEEDD